MIDSSKQEGNAFVALPTPVHCVDVRELRMLALQSLVSLANLFELTDTELVDEAGSILYNHGLDRGETGALLVAFDSLSADEFKEMHLRAFRNPS